MKRILLLLLLAPLSITTFAQNLKLGRPAPAIVIDEWLSNGVDKNGQTLDLKDKFIVLEFWATWCGPCIRAIPHINDLKTKFGADSVVFVSISRESKEKINAFLKTREMKASIGWDSRGVSQSNYGVSSIPAAFLINKNGVLVWKGHPASLTDEIMLDAIKNKNSSTYTGTPGETLFGLQIQRSSSQFDFSEKTGGWGEEESNVSYTNFKVLDVFLDIIGIPLHRAEIVGNVNQERYDIKFLYNAASLPGTMGAPTFLLNALMSTFEVRVNEAVIEKEVWILRLPDNFGGDDKVPPSSTGKFNVTSANGMWILQSVSLNEMASLLENELGTIVLPYVSTNSTRYNLTIGAGPTKNMELIKQELNQKYGITLYKEKRKINMTVIQFL